MAHWEVSGEGGLFGLPSLVRGHSFGRKQCGWLRGEKDNISRVVDSPRNTGHHKATGTMDGPVRETLSKHRLPLQSVHLRSIWEVTIDMTATRGMSYTGAVAEYL